MMCRSVESGEVLDEIPFGLQTSEVHSGEFPIMRQPSEGVMVTAMASPNT